MIDTTSSEEMNRLTEDSSVGQDRSTNYYISMVNLALYTPKFAVEIRQNLAPYARFAIEIFAIEIIWLSEYPKQAFASCQLNNLWLQNVYDANQ